MTARMQRFCIGGLVATIVAYAADPATSVTRASADQQEIVLQLKMLRAEIDTLKLDFLQRSIPAIEKEIADARREQALLETEETKAGVRLQEFDKRVAENVLNPDELLQAQNIRAGLDGGIFNQMREQRATLSSKLQHLDSLLQRWTREFHDVLARARNKHQ